MAERDAGEGQDGRLVWSRDVTPTSRRWLRWALPIPGVVIVLGVIDAVAAEGESAGILIGFGVVLAALMVAGPWIVDRRNKNTPEIRTDGRVLTFGDRAVAIAEVRSWGVSTVNHQASSGGPTARWSVTSARFDLHDGSNESFAVASLAAEEHDELIAAIARYVHVPPTN